MVDCKILSLAGGNKPEKPIALLLEDLPVAMPN